MSKVEITLQEIKPCPFCAGRAELIELSRPFYKFAIQCIKCGATVGGSAFENNSYNIKMWNMRAIKYD